jgi:hypothetical protein
MLFIFYCEIRRLQQSTTLRRSKHFRNISAASVSKSTINYSCAKVFAKNSSARVALLKLNISQPVISAMMKANP